MQETAPNKLLVSAGLVTWAVVGLPTMLRFASGAGAIDRRGAMLGFCAAFAVFGAAFFVSAGTELASTRAARIAALALQSGCALVVIALGRGGFEDALLAVVAGQVPLFVDARFGLGWIVVQSVPATLIHVARGSSTTVALFSGGAYVGFQLFAVGTAHLARREAMARAELARVHAELLATRELFADSTRTAERLRISRELHDSIGHNLTALSINLEVARNTAEGRAKEPVDRAHALTKELLNELRVVVGAMREDRPVDLGHALRTLASGVSKPRVHLTLPPELPVDAALAHTLFRCVQEVVTNVLRHADAENLFIEIAIDGDTIAVRARDDGRGAARITRGNGLLGLKERIEEGGGRFEIDGAPGEGVTVRALVPLGPRP